MECPYCGKTLETVSIGKRYLMVCPDTVTAHPQMVYVPQIIYDRAFAPKQAAK
jgi:hypothetical protein